MGRCNRVPEKPEVVREIGVRSLPLQPDQMQEFRLDADILIPVNMVFQALARRKCSKDDVCFIWEAENGHWHVWRHFIG